MALRRCALVLALVLGLAALGSSLHLAGADATEAPALGTKKCDIITEQLASWGRGAQRCSARATNFYGPNRTVDFGGGAAAGGGKPRIALALRGEAFRSGRTRGARVEAFGQEPVDATDFPWESQKLASASQVSQVIEPLEACGFIVDVFITSYPPRGDPRHNATRDLLAWYAPRVVDALFVGPEQDAWEGVPRSGQAAMVHRSFAAVAARHSGGVHYSALLSVRLDYAFRQPLAHLPDAKWDTILFAHAGPCRGPNHADGLLWVPAVALNCMLNAGWDAHNTARRLRFNLPEPQDFDFMIKTAHKANTAWGWNPLYYMPSRTVQELDVSCGFLLLPVDVCPVSEERRAAHVQAIVANLGRQGRPATIDPLVPAGVAAKPTTVGCDWAAWGQSVQHALRSTTGEADFAIVARDDVDLGKAYHVGASLGGNLYVGFGATAAPDIPAILIATPKMLESLAARLEEGQPPPPPRGTGQVSKWLSATLNASVRPVDELGRAGG